MTRIHSAIAALSFALALTAATSAEWTLRKADVGVRLSFEDVSHDLPLGDPRGGPLTPVEMATVVALARSEFQAAFAGLRIALVDNPRAAYQVWVTRDLPPRPGPRPLAAAESVALGPLGGLGWVSFKAIASLAASHASGSASRAAIIEGIGRGIGRIAAHEFVHQLMPATNLHASADVESYEYRSADRAAQFYGPMRWAFAYPLLSEKIGTRN